MIPAQPDYVELFAVSLNLLAAFVSLLVFVGAWYVGWFILDPLIDFVMQLWE